MSVEFVLVINPRAGERQRKNRFLIPRLREMASTAGLLVEVDRLEALEPSLERALTQQPRFVAVFGGDGSIHHVVDRLVKIVGRGDLPALLPLGGGTMNCFVSDLGYRMAADLLLERVAEEEGGFEERGLLVLEDDRTGQKRYGFTFGNGLVYEGLQEYARRPPSAINGARVIAGGLFMPHLRERYTALHPMRVELDGKPHPSKSFLGILSSSLAASVLGFRPYAGPLADRSRQFSLLATSYSLKELIPLAPAVLWGRGRLSLNADFYTNQVIEEARLGFSRGYTLDGETFSVEGEASMTLRVDRIVRIPRPRS